LIYPNEFATPHTIKHPYINTLYQEGTYVNTMSPLRTSLPAVRLQHGAYTGHVSKSIDKTTTIYIISYNKTVSPCSSRERLSHEDNYSLFLSVSSDDDVSSVAWD